jgi:hypothetical protein
MTRDENDKPRTLAEIVERIDRARQLCTTADLGIQKALHDLRISRMVLAESMGELLRGAN